MANIFDNESPNVITQNTGFGGQQTPTAKIHIAGSNGLSNTAPLKLSAGTSLNNPENGAIEFDGNHLYITISGIRSQLDNQAGGSGVLILESLTTTQRNALTPINGLLLNNSTVNQFQKYENDQWVDISKSPATKVIAPSGSGYSADYYTTGTNDDVIINEALTAISSTGGKILLKMGNYQINSSITIPGNNVILQGEGEGTYIKVANSTNIHGITISAVSNVTIADLFLDGNGATQTIQVHGIRIGQASSYVNVYRCKIINASHHNINCVIDTGFGLVSNIRVKECEIYGAGQFGGATADGTEIALKASYGLVEGCFITSNSFCGIEIYNQGDHCIAQNNFIIWNGESDSLGAIQVGSGNENSIVAGNIITGAGVASQAGIKVIANYCTVTNNTIFDLTNGWGIWISGASNCSFIGNTIKNLSEEGIYDEGTYNTISENTIYSCLMGINVRPTAFYDTINGNIISFNQQFGIFINQSATNITVSSNHLINNGQSAANTYDGIQSQAPNILLIGNQCYDNQGSPTQRYGIRVQNNTALNFSVIDNFFSGNVSGGLSIISTGQTYIASSNKGDDNITLDGTATRTITTTRNSSGAGNLLNIQAPGAQSGGTDLAGGVLRLSAGIATGIGRSDIQFYNAQAGSSGTVDNNPALTAILTGNGPPKFILANTTTDTQNGFNLSGTANQYLYQQRNTTVNTSGKSLILQAGGADSGGSDKSGGGLILSAGISTGMGTGTIQFQTPTPQASTNTTDNTPSIKMTLDGIGRLFVGGATSPTAIVHLTNGTAAAGTSPLKFTAGTVLTAPEDGSVEYDGSHLYLSVGSTRYQLDQQGGAGVASITGTVDQIIASASTGAVTLSTPQNIDSTATPTFAGLTNNGNESIGGALSVKGTGNFNENTTTVGIFAGVSTTARLLLTNGTAAQNWEIDNSAGLLRIYQPGTVRWQIDGSGNTRQTGYARIGSTSAPTNTTAGDLTAVRGFILGTSANTLTVGPNGTTNPQFNVDASTTSVATGINFKGAAAAGGFAVSVLSSGTNEALTVDGKGTGTIGINTVGTTSGLVTIGNSTSNAGVAINGSQTLTGKITSYNNISTIGQGVPSIYGYGRSTAQTAAVTSVATYTNGATDGSFLISANVNVTTFSVGTFNVTVTYTDETNTSRTLTLNFSSITGTLGIAIAAAGAFEGIPVHIRSKASTAITVATSGTFTSLTYNVESTITQIA